MEFYSVTISWTKPDGTTGNIRFVCPKTQIMTQLNQALTSEVAPTFGPNADISMQSIGQVRGVS